MGGSGEDARRALRSVSGRLSSFLARCEMLTPAAVCLSSSSKRASLKLSARGAFSALVPERAIPR